MALTYWQTNNNARVEAMRREHYTQRLRLGMRLAQVPPVPVLVPAATEIVLDVLAFDPFSTTQEPDRTTFAMSGGILSVNETRYGLFKTGAWYISLRFDRDQPGVIWTSRTRVGYDLGLGSEFVAREIVQPGVVSNQGLRIAVDFDDNADGPDSTRWALAPAYAGVMQLEFAISHDGADQTMQIQDMRAGVHPLAEAEIR